VDDTIVYEMDTAFAGLAAHWTLGPRKVLKEGDGNAFIKPRN
jgi:hypothetical protein